MNIVQFQISDLEKMMVFLDDNLTENYEKRVFEFGHFPSFPTFPLFTEG